MRRLSTLSLLCFATLLTVNGFAQLTTPSASAPALVPIVAPMFLENGEFSTMVTIVNDLKDSHPATMVLTDAAGVEIARQELSILGHTNQVVQVRELLSKSRSNAIFGSILITTPNGDAMPIAAQTSVTWSGTGRAFFEQEMLMPGGNAQTFRATAVDVRDSPLIAIKSFSAAMQSITIACLPEKGSARNANLQLAPGEVRLVAACAPHSDAQTFLSTEVRKDSDDNSTDGHWLGSVGIAVTTDGQPQDLAVSGFSIYRDERGPYFSSLFFSNESGQSPSGTVFAGVPIGKVKLLSNTMFHPLLGITNFSEQPALVKVTVASTISGKPDTDVKSVRLPAESTTTVRLPPDDRDGITTSLVVNSDQPTGGVTASFVAKGDVIIPLVELQPKNSVLAMSSGGHPWSIANGRSSTLLLFNHSSQTEKFNVGIGSGSHTWQQTYDLASMETRAISLNDIVIRQQADMKGRHLPVHARSGQVAWTIIGSGIGKGRLLQSDPGVGLARSFSCGECVRLCPHGTLTPDSSSLIDTGDTGDLGGIVVDDCVISCNYRGLGCGQANQDTGYEDFPDVFTWTLPSFLSLMSVDSGNGTASFVGIGPGSDFGSWHAKISDDPNQCTAAGSGPTTSQMPDHLFVLKDTSGTVNCGSNPSSEGRTITYEVDAANNQKILSPFLQVRENVPPTDSTCNGNPIFTGSTCFFANQAEPEITGEFNDNFSPGCPSSPSNSPCGYTFSNQQWQWCSGTGTTPSIGTIGFDDVKNTLITIDGNILGFTLGTTFPK